MFLVHLFIIIVACNTVYSGSELNWLGNVELRKALNWSEMLIKRMLPMEENLSRSSPRKEPDKKALQAYLLYRGARFVSDTYCRRYGKDKSQCVKLLSKVTVPCEETDYECPSSIYRSYDGSCNDPNQPTKGAVNTTFSRLLPPSYRDGLWEVNYLPSPTEVTEAMEKVLDISTNWHTIGISAWAAFVSADLARTEPFAMLNNGAEIQCCENGQTRLPRYVHPLCLPVLDGMKCTNYVRSVFSTSCTLGPAQQVNRESHFLDASPLYGLSRYHVYLNKAYRSGLIKSKNMDKCEGTSDCLLQLMISLLRKEHNRIALSLKQINNHWGDELVFEESRKIVMAEVQHITYFHWLPSITGQSALKIAKDNSYISHISPDVLNSFASAAIKVIVSGLSKSYRPIVFNSIVGVLYDDASELLFRKMISFNHSDVAEGPSSEELSLAIQIGRDHGLASFSDFRKYFGLPHGSFDEISKDFSKSAFLKLKKIYKNVKNIDLVVGGIVERPKKDSFLGSVLTEIINVQMARTKTGDRFFYTNTKQPSPFTQDQLTEIKKSSFSRLICDNFRSINEIHPDLFNFNSLKSSLTSCDNTNAIHKIDLSKWKDGY